MKEQHKSMGFANTSDWGIAPDADRYVALPSRESLLFTVTKRIETGKTVQFIAASPGMGKTLLARILERDFTAKHHPVCLINATHDIASLVTEIHVRLGLPPLPETAQETERLTALFENLHSLAYRRRNAVLLVIDEAQLLAANDVLHMVTTLDRYQSNFDSPSIFLVLLGHVEIIPLAKQCGIDCLHIDPLDREEAITLVHAKNELYSGDNEPIVFKRSVLNEILHASQGNPQMLVRLIACLFMTMADNNVRRADKDMVATCLAIDPDMSRLHVFSKCLFRVASKTRILILTLAVAFAFFWYGFPKTSNNPVVQSTRNTVDTLKTNVQHILGTAPTAPIPSEKPQTEIITPKETTTTPMLLGGVLTTPKELNSILTRLYGLPVSEVIPLVKLVNPQLDTTPADETIPVLMPSIPAQAPPADINFIVLASQKNINQGLQEQDRLARHVSATQILLWYTPKTGMHVDIVLAHSKLDSSGYEAILSQLEPSIRKAAVLLDHFPEDASFFSTIKND